MSPSFMMGSYGANLNFSKKQTAVCQSVNKVCHEILKDLQRWDEL